MQGEAVTIASWLIFIPKRPFHNLWLKTQSMFQSNTARYTKPSRRATDGRNKYQSAKSNVISEGKKKKKRIKSFHLTDKQLQQLCFQPSIFLNKRRVKARKFTSVPVTTKMAFTSFHHTLSYGRQPGLPPSQSSQPRSKDVRHRRR